MKIKHVLSLISLTLCITAFSQKDAKVPCVIKLKDGKSIDAIHFGQLKCGKEVYSQNYIIMRGKFMESPSETTDYREIERIVPEGFTDEPAVSVGNQKSRLTVYKKDGVSFTLEDAELAMSCYGPGDKYNTIVVQIFNPLTNQASEQTINMMDIQSIIFK